MRLQVAQRRSCTMDYIARYIELIKSGTQAVLADPRTSRQPRFLKPVSKLKADLLQSVPTLSRLRFRRSKVSLLQDCLGLVIDFMTRHLQKNH